MSAQLLEARDQLAVRADLAGMRGRELRELEVRRAAAVVLDAEAQRGGGLGADEAVLHQRLAGRVAEEAALEVLDRLDRLRSAATVGLDLEADRLQRALHVLGRHRGIGSLLAAARVAVVGAVALDEVLQGLRVADPDVEVDL